MLIMACDGGLAAFGVVLVDLKRMACFRADVFTSKPTPKAKRARQRVRPGSERIVRARTLANWLLDFAEGVKVDLVAAEELAGSQSAAACIGMGLGWGVLAAWCEFYSVPSIAAIPKKWRKALCESGSEVDAQNVGLERFGFADSAAFDALMPFVDPSDTVHAFDALGIAAWAAQTDVVREMTANERQLELTGAKP